MATLALCSKDETADRCTITVDNFRSWKRKNGRHAAFVVQISGADGDDDETSEILVCTFSDMRRLPAGSYQAQLVRKCAIPDAEKKQLRGAELWKCV